MKTKLNGYLRWMKILFFAILAIVIMLIALFVQSCLASRVTL